MPNCWPQRLLECITTGTLEIENNLSCSGLYTVLYTRLSNRKVDIFFTGKVTLPTVIPTIKSRKPKCSDNFCDQKCQDSPTEGAQCSCRDGYRLQPDRVSCQGNHTLMSCFRCYMFISGCFGWKVNGKTSSRKRKILEWSQISWNVS